LVEEAAAMAPRVRLTATGAVVVLLLVALVVVVVVVDGEAAAAAEEAGVEDDVDETEAEDELCFGRVRLAKVVRMMI